MKPADEYLFKLAFAHYWFQLAKLQRLVVVRTCVR